LEAGSSSLFSNIDSIIFNLILVEILARRLLSRSFLRWPHNNLGCKAGALSLNRNDVKLRAKNATKSFDALATFMGGIYKVLNPKQ